MINIPISNPKINYNYELKKTSLSTNNKSNEMLQYDIKKDYEVKNIYYDKNNQDITNKPNLWVNNTLNYSNIKFVWDNVTKIFAFKMYFINKNDIDEIIIKINNKNFFFKPNLKYENNLYCQEIYSFDLDNNSFNINNIKNIQINLMNKSITKSVNIILGSYINSKNDFNISSDKEFILRFQNSIEIKGMEIKIFFSEIKLNAKNFIQGTWNQKIMEIEHTDKNIFNRNKIEVKLLEGIPITSSSKTNFNTHMNEYQNKSTVEINQNTYYDLNKKETMKGIGINSNIGYIPPFEFSGIFFPSLIININDMQFQISWQQKFEKPYFKKNEGLIKINLDSSFNKEINNKEWINISSDLLNEAKEYNFSKYQDFEKWLKEKNRS